MKALQTYKSLLCTTHSTLPVCCCLKGFENDYALIWNVDGYLEDVFNFKSNFFRENLKTITQFRAILCIWKKKKSELIHRKHISDSKGIFHAQFQFPFKDINWKGKHVFRLPLKKFHSLVSYNSVFGSTVWVSWKHWINTIENTG